MIKCMEIFDDMVESSIKPDAHIYSILSKGYVPAQELEKTDELFDAMKASGVRLNVVIFTRVINGWCNSGSMDSAITVFRKIIESRISLNLKGSMWRTRSQGRSRMCSASWKGSMSVPRGTCSSS